MTEGSEDLILSRAEISFLALSSGDLSTELVFLYRLALLLTILTPSDVVTSSDPVGVYDAQAALVASSFLISASIGGV